MTTEVTEHPELVDVEALRKQARDGRKAFALSVLSRFVVKMREVIRDYLKSREEGVSREDGVKGIELVFRDVWPGRTTKFDQCSGCCNTGWRLVECDYAMRCGRERCSREDDAWAHTFVVPCDCVLGDPFRRSGQRRQATSDDDLAAVGKTKKRRGWSRLGR